jgi:hypothetical protein
MRTLHRHRRPSTRGYTLLEIGIALTLLTLVLVNLYMLLGDSGEAMRAKAAEFEAEIEARRILDRAAMNLIGAAAGTLVVPLSAPQSSESIDFAVNTGFQDGAPTWSPNRRIAREDGSSVIWREKPGEAGERVVKWTGNAPGLLEGELDNELDDNGNGLIDETALSYEVNGSMITIRITIKKPKAGGGFTTKTLQTRVTCRN